MEFNFDLVSFVLGGAAAILCAELARLAGYVAGYLYARLEYCQSPLEPVGYISADSALIRSGI